jgi:hypothetical protein
MSGEFMRKAGRLEGQSPQPTVAEISADSEYSIQKQNGRPSLVAQSFQIEI